MLFILSFTKEFNNNQKRQTNIRPNESNIQLSSVSEINNPQYDNSHNSVI